MKRKTTPKQTTAPRRSGASKGVTVTRDKGGISFSVETDELQSPPEVVSASWTHAVQRADGVSFLFAHSHPLSGKATFLVEVFMPIYAFRDFFWPSVGGEFLQSISSSLTSIEQQWVPDTISDLDEAPFHARRASIASISFTGGEAEIDFHMLSTADLSRAIQGKKDDLRLDSILKILLSAPLLKKLLLECAELEVNGGV